LLFAFWRKTCSYNYLQLFIPPALVHAAETLYYSLDALSIGHLIICFAGLVYRFTVVVTILNAGYLTIKNKTKQNTMHQSSKICSFPIARMVCVTLSKYVDTRKTRPAYRILIIGDAKSVERKMII